MSDDILNTPQRREQDGVLLSSGVRVRAKPLPRRLIRLAIEGVPDPEIPVATLADGTQVPNPDSPALKDALQAAERERMNRLERLVFGMGLEILPPFPAGVPEPQGNDWVDWLSQSGVQVDTSNSFTRIADWLQLIACPRDDDLLRAFAEGQRAVGLLEVEVITAMRFFPTDEGRDPSD